MEGLGALDLTDMEQLLAKLQKHKAECMQLEGKARIDKAAEIMASLFGGADWVDKVEKLGPKGHDGGKETSQTPL